jgi:membrane-associated phospholipid phosphatase
MPDFDIGERTSLSQRARHFLAARLDRKSELGIGLTISVLVAALAIWALSGLLDAVLDNDLLVRWDAIVETWFHIHATATGLSIFYAVTQLGSPGAVVVVGVVALYLWHARVFFLLWTWLGVNIGGAAIEYVLKTTIHRSRPQYAAAYLHGHSYSFPSGHTMGSTICYLLLAYLIGSHPGTSRIAGRVAVLAAWAVVLAVGFSRLYLAVHYPSDVLGGLAAGLAWLSVCGATRRFVIARRGLLDGGWSRASDQPAAGSA